MFTKRLCVLSSLSSSLLNAHFSWLALPLQEEQKTVQTGQGTLFNKNKTKHPYPPPTPQQKSKQRNLHPTTKPNKQKASNPQKQRTSPPKNVLGNEKRVHAQNHVKITVAVYTCTYRAVFSEQRIAVFNFVVCLGSFTLPCRNKYFIMSYLLQLVYSILCQTSVGLSLWESIWKIKISPDCSKIHSGAWHLKDCQMGFFTYFR